MLKKAMIMAAGVGSRLDPLTRAVPKPLVPLTNIPAMDILVNHLIKNGISNIIANTYYMADLIEQHYRNLNNCNINMQFIREEQLSGTAGGVKKCQFFFDDNEDFIILSGDGLTNVDIISAYKKHLESNSIITVVTKKVVDEDVSKYGIVVKDDKGFVVDFQEKPCIEEAKSNLINTGIYICNYKIFNYIPQNEFYDFAKNLFPKLLANDIKINTYEHNGYWSDIGSIEQYILSNKDIINYHVDSIKPLIHIGKNGKYVTGKNLNIDSSSQIIGNCVIGDNCKVGKNCLINNSILWDNVVVEDNIKIENSIIMSDIRLEDSVYDKIMDINEVFVNKMK